MQEDHIRKSSCKYNSDQRETEIRMSFHDSGSCMTQVPAACQAVALVELAGQCCLAASRQSLSRRRGDKAAATSMTRKPVLRW